MSSKSNPLDPRVQRTRQMLEDALLQLLGEKRFQAISVQEIATRAGVNRVTVYDHYEDKYDLYRHLVRKRFQTIVTQTMAGISESGPDCLRALVQAALLFFDALNVACPPTDRQSRPLVEVEVQNQLYDHLLDWLQAQPAADAARPTSPEMTARMLSWAIFGAGLEWEQSSSALTVDEMADQIVAVLAQLTAAASVQA